MIDLDGKEILPCSSNEFREYGRILTGIDLKEAYQWAQNVEIPEHGNAYLASDASAEALKCVQKVGFEVYGGLSYQAGPCRGHNKVLNGIEYHNSSEVAICLKPCVMFLGKLCDMEENTYDGSKAIPFYFPEGTIVETYATTLHYTPCAIDNEPFLTICMLPKGTGEALENGPVGILKKKNKWFIAHPENIEKVKAGDVPGLKGKMRGIK